MNRKEYEWVRQNREVLLEFCSEIDSHDLTREIEGFGFNNIKGALVHVADCYHAWLGSYILLKTNKPITPKEQVKDLDISDLRVRFAQVDELIDELLETKEDQMDIPIQKPIPWRESKEAISLTPRKLLMHTITHEYHHKGQIVAMARKMGYEPPNTDVLGADD